MGYDLEMLVRVDMFHNGYDPDLWADVVEYWNERLG
jgi:hypothetical protein